MEGRSRRKTGMPGRRKIVAASAVLAGFLLLGGGLYAAHRVSENRYDANAVDLSTVERPKTKEELQLQIQRAADQSSFRFQMNSQPVLKTTEDGQGQTAAWGIVNSIENKVDMEVVIQLDDGTEVYHSSRLQPGQQELKGSPLIRLEPGTYHAVATAYALETGSDQELGTVTAELVLEVEGSTEDTM